MVTGDSQKINECNEIVIMSKYISKNELRTAKISQ
jgi:hypothetical protein